jgi:hypothetical protein
VFLRAPGTYPVAISISFLRPRKITAK